MDNSHFLSWSIVITTSFSIQLTIRMIMAQASNNPLLYLKIIIYMKQLILATPFNGFFHFKALFINLARSLVSSFASMQLASFGIS